MNFENFIAKQEEIYSRFRDISKIKEDGLAPNVSNNQGGYLIAFRHSSCIADKIGEFSEKVNKIVPAIKYGPKNAHTTISTYLVTENFSPETINLESLSRIVHGNISLLEKVSIDYKECLLNQNTGIFAGYPNLEFFETAKRIAEYATNKGIKLSLPWGAHITASRFLENGSHEEISELLDLFKNNAQLGVSIPQIIDVGSFIVMQSEFKYEIYERFQLS